VRGRSLELHHISTDVLFAALNSESSLWASLLSEINQRYRFALEQIEEQAFSPLRLRLMRALLVLVDAYGIQQDEGTVIQLRLAQDHLGNLLGVSRQSINKVIKGLESEGVIQMHYRRVIVRDVEALRATVHMHATGHPLIS
jgi:CRP/FNR family cyclic AMP-dependent transcriptional regulator